MHITVCINGHHFEVVQWTTRVPNLGSPILRTAHIIVAKISHAHTQPLSLFQTICVYINQHCVTQGNITQCSALSYDGNTCSNTQIQDLWRIQIDIPLAQLSYNVRSTVHDHATVEMYLNASMQHYGFIRSTDYCLLLKCAQAKHKHIVQLHQSDFEHLETVLAHHGIWAITLMKNNRTCWYFTDCPEILFEHASLGTYFFKHHQRAKADDPLVAYDVRCVITQNNKTLTFLTEDGTFNIGARLKLIHHPIHADLYTVMCIEHHYDHNQVPYYNRLHCMPVQNVWQMERISPLPLSDVSARISDKHQDHYASMDQAGCYWVQLDIDHNKQLSSVPMLQPNVGWHLPLHPQTSVIVGHAEQSPIIIGMIPDEQTKALTTQDTANLHVLGTKHGARLEWNDHPITPSIRVSSHGGMQQLTLSSAKHACGFALETLLGGINIQSYRDCMFRSQQQYRQHIQQDYNIIAGNEHSVSTQHGNIAIHSGGNMAFTAEQSICMQTMQGSFLMSSREQSEIDTKGIYTLTARQGNVQISCAQNVEMHASHAIQFLGHREVRIQKGNCVVVFNNQGISIRASRITIDAEFTQTFGTKVSLEGSALKKDTHEKIHHNCMLLMKTK